MVDANYRDFTSKVAAARHKPLASILEIAQGRVWMGDQAKGNGLVDELGGLDRAVELIRQKAGVPKGDAIELVSYPPRRGLLDLLLKQSGQDSDAEGDFENALRTGGLKPIADAWHDSGLRVWMRGGMLRMMPMRVTLR
jgi:protease-4